MSKRFVALSAAGLGLLGCRYYFGGEQNTYTTTMRGRKILITGNPDGVATEIVRDLANRGAFIYWYNHDSKKVRRNISDLAKLSYYLNKEDPYVEYHKLDPTNSTDVKSVADSLKEQSIIIDVLINVPYDYNSDSQTHGLNSRSEATLRNLKAPIDMLEQMHPLLHMSGEGRVINLVPYLRDEPVKDGMPNYDDLFSQEVKDVNFSEFIEDTSKAILALTKCQQDQMHVLNRHIKVVAVNPGMTRDRLVRTYMPSFVTGRMYDLMTILAVPFAKSDKEAAQTALYAIMKPWHEIKGGQYYSNCKEANANYGDWEKLWEKTTNFVRASENKN